MCTVMMWTVPLFVIICLYKAQGQQVLYFLPNCSFLSCIVLSVRLYFTVLFMIPDYTALHTVLYGDVTDFTILNCTALYSKQLFCTSLAVRTWLTVLLFAALLTYWLTWLRLTVLDCTWYCTVIECAVLDFSVLFCPSVGPSYLCERTPAWLVGWQPTNLEIQIKRQDAWLEG